MGDFKDKVVVITGAGGGLGKAHAIEFAKRGAKIVLNDLGGSGDGKGQSDMVDSAVEEIRALGAEAIANKASVSDKEGAQSIIDDAVAAFGTVDILVNNAGILRDKSFKNMDMADWDIVMNVHMNGSAYVTKAAWPIMYEKNYGRIVFTSSSSGIYGNFGQTNYAAAKAGVIGFTQTWARELGPHGVRSVAVCPGFVQTPILETIPQPVMQALLAKVPLGRLAKPEEIAGVYAFLASEDAGYINGVAIEVSGGIMM
mgnify:CR=1 FL=1